MSKEISQELLKILVCPKSKKNLIYNKNNQDLICEESKLIYKIVDGIPIMIDKFDNV